MDDDSFQPIAAYGFLSDCNTAALVSSGGSVDWLCLPRFDAPSVFARLLDPAAGHWSIRPAGAFHSERRYADGTLVLETAFTTAEGSVRLRDALAFPQGQRSHEIGLGAPRELLRCVEGVGGSVELELELVPRPEYGLVRPLLRATDDGARTFGGPNQVVLRAGVGVEVEVDAVRARFRLGEGDRVGFALRWVPPEAQEPPEPTSPDEVASRLDDTATAWRSWEAEHSAYEGRYTERVRLASRLLQGLTYRPTGAIVAAPTTSLPETVGGGRNWDYRYSWIRDASLTLEALYVGACPEEVDLFVSYMTSSAGGSAGEDGSLQIMYGVAGEHDLSERELGHLRGWRDSRPVRVGNAAWRQTQLDVYGELLSALELYDERLGALHPEIQRFAAGLADAAARRWREPDAGMWEQRGEPRHYVSSKVLCWVALDRAVKLAPKLGEHARPDEWRRERDDVHRTVLREGWSERRRAFTQSFGSDELDAAQLLMPLVGFLPATDGRVRATVEAIERDLTRDGLVLRYAGEGDGGGDGEAGREGTFVICSFWLVSCLARLGEVERGERLFARVCGHANDLGLLAEEIDAASGELLGNFPQAFSHIGLVNAAHELDRAYERDASSEGGRAQARGGRR